MCESGRVGGVLLLYGINREGKSVVIIGLCILVV